MTTELDTFYEMVEDIGIAMMTTRRPDGHLESRAMANQKRAAGADLWFVTAEGTGKLRSLEADPHINLSYYKDRTREWISVSGLATISRDRQKIRELYAPDWKMWFPEEGDARHSPATFWIGASSKEWSDANSSRRLLPGRRVRVDSDFAWCGAAARDFIFPATTHADGIRRQPVV